MTPTKTMWIALLALWAGCGGRAVGVPEQHRLAGETCSGTRPAAGCNFSPGPTGTCQTDSECTAGNNGRCSPPTHNGTCACTYDDCNSDADCAAGQLCACGAAIAGGRGANACLPSNCRSDADCGAGQYCAPSLDSGCGYYSGIVRYACTTDADTCRSNADCGGSNDGFGTAYCAYFLELGHWACSTSQCLG